MKTREPKWFEGIPICTEDECPMYDGKRCSEMGFRPDRICEPQTKDMANALREIEKYDDATNPIDVVQIARRALTTE